MVHPHVASPLKGDREPLKEEVQLWLNHWFALRTKMKTGEPAEPGLAQPGPDTDYFAAGWLTSMEVVEFVTEIENRFSFQFSDSDLQDPRFVNLAGLSELIFERSTPTSRSR
jgi:acyl carrier protein